MQIEEAHVFPLAERTLTAEDWAAVDAEAAKRHDPLLGATSSSGFAALRDDFLRWEREDQTS